MFPDRLKKLRKEKKVTHEDMAEFLGITRQGYGHYENGKREPDQETMGKLADFFDTTIDYLQGRTKEPYYALTEKDERDIAKELEKMMNDLDNENSLSFLGEPMSEEDRELLRISLENTIRISKEMAKKKFTPKKYRD